MVFTQEIKLPDWFYHQASITEYLKKKSGGDFFIKLLREAWGGIALEERVLLGVSPEERIRIREVNLYCHNKPVLYGRTLLPESLIENPKVNLKNLGERPLGEVLFDVEGVQRESFDFYSVDINAHLYAVFSEYQSVEMPSIPIRRSVWKIQQQPLLLYEAPIF